MICSGTQGWRGGRLHFTSRPFGPELTFWLRLPTAGDPALQTQLLAPSLRLGLAPAQVTATYRESLRSPSLVSGPLAPLRCGPGLGAGAIISMKQCWNRAWGP